MGGRDGDVLLLYASTHGHTAKIAARIAEGLRAEGIDEVSVRDAADIRRVLAPLHHQPLSLSS